MKRRAMLSTVGLALPPLRALGRNTAEPSIARLVIPSAAGGVSHKLAHAMSLAWPAYAGNPLVAMERPGGAGALAVQMVSQGPTDGSMLLLGNTGTQVVRPTLRPVPGSEPLVPLALVASTPGVLVVSAHLAVASLADVVGVARDSPTSLAYASAGSGSLGHLVMEALWSQAGVALLHVPYKSVPESIPDLVSGRVHVHILSVSAAAPLARQGRVRPLAVTSPSRIARFPHLPTLQELGFDGAEIENWHGLFVHESVPAARQQTLAAILASVLIDPDFRTSLDREHMTVVSTPARERLAHLISHQKAKLGRLISLRGLKFD